MHPGGIELGDDMARHIAPRCLGQHCRGARLIGRGFRVGFAVVQIDVEQMDFVVARLNCPFAIDQKGPVGDLVARQPDRQRPAQQLHPQIVC